MKDLVSLRATALASNLAFLAYGIALDLAPMVQALLEDLEASRAVGLDAKMRETRMIVPRDHDERAALVEHFIGITRTSRATGSA